MRYGFIKDNCRQYPVRVLCRVLQVHPSGYYAWVKRPMSARARADARQTELIEQSWRESGGVYGYRKVYDDLQELGERCGKHRTHRLMRLAGLRSQTGYKRRKAHYGGQPANVAPNTLEREFSATRPNEAWVTDITMIRTYEGWLYLAAVLDLFSRQVANDEAALGSVLDEAASHGTPGLVIDQPGSIGRST